MVWVKKVKNRPKRRKMLKIDPKRPIFSKMANFRPRGQKYSKTHFVCPKFTPETIFDGFWAFLRFFDFSLFWTHIHTCTWPPKGPNVQKSPFFDTGASITAEPIFRGEKIYSLSLAISGPMMKKIFRFRKNYGM